MGAAPGPATRRVVLCADDFGMEPSVNEGILRLAGSGRLGAATCMVELPAWREGAVALAALRGRTAAGLHLFLDTRSARDALVLAARAALGLLDEAAIRARVAAQLDRFEQAYGAPPAIVDGHHHVHQVAPVRRALLGVLRERYGERLPYVRNLVPLRARGGKAAVVAGLGARSLRDALRRGGFPHNTDFAGVYDLSARSDFPGLVRGWLSDVADGALLMCHPGLPGPEPAAMARGAELRYLESDRFLSDCAEAGVSLVRPQEASA